MTAIWNALKTFLTLPILSTVIRAVLKFGGGYLVARGLTNDAQLEVAVAAVLSLVGFVWGILAKKPALPAADGIGTVPVKK